MQDDRPFGIRYGEGLVMASVAGILYSWFSADMLMVFLASCTAAAIGGALLWHGSRRTGTAR